MIIKVCTWRSCTENGSEYIATRLERDIAFYNIHDMAVERCTCQGRCKEGPVVAYDRDIQTRMNPVKASELMRKKVEMIKNQLKARQKNEVVSPEKEI